MFEQEHSSSPPSCITGDLANSQGSKCQADEAVHVSLWLRWNFAELGAHTIIHQAYAAPSPRGFVPNQLWSGLCMCV